MALMGRCQRCKASIVVGAPRYRYLCTECSGEHSKISYATRTSNLGKCLYVAGLEETRAQAILRRIAQRGGSHPRKS